VVALVPLPGCLSDEGDIGAEDLRARLADSLSFDGGKRETGPAPAPSADAGEEQGIVEAATPSVHGGQGFRIRLVVVGPTSGATVDVVLAIDGWDESHFRIPCEVRSAEGQHIVSVAGVLEPDTALFGRTFGMRAALVDPRGDVSDYVSLRLSVRPSRCEPAEEMCNGLDDDCSGEADDGLDPIHAAEVRGECAGNVQVCLGEGGYQDAPDNHVPGDDVCNGLDDDCDGQVDDEWVCGDWPGSQERPVPSCRELVAHGIEDDGVYWLDPDGPGPHEPFQASCDMETAGGGWTLVFVPESTNRGAHDIAYTVPPAGLLLLQAGHSDEVLMAFRSPDLALAEDGWATLPLLDDWRGQSPMSHHQGVASDVPVSVGGGPPEPKTVFYGWSNWSTDFCSGDWYGVPPTVGRVCVQDSAAPFYASFGHDSPDGCSRGDQRFDARRCDDGGLRFTMAVR